jgi:hypothetical protein
LGKSRSGRRFNGGLRTRAGSILLHCWVALYRLDVHSSPHQVYRQTGGILEGVRVFKSKWTEGRRSDEEVEGEEKHAKEDEETAPGEAAARELHDGLNKAGGNDDQARFAATFVEGARRNIAREVSAEERDFGVEPERKFLTVTPGIDGACEEEKIAQTGENTE